MNELCEVCEKNPVVTFKGLTNCCLDCCLSGNVYLHEWASGIGRDSAERFRERLAAANPVIKGGNDER